jgi:hypothetical protein
VRLAILKLAQRDPQRVERLVQLARTDYRDVLSPAEYPRYDKLDLHSSEEERTRAIELDWAEYQEWLNRSM